MINVTKTYMPDKEKYISYVDKIFESGWVTNNGALVRELETRLAEYLGVKNIVLVANGTIALEIAYRLLKLKGEVITTPFSFVATTSSLVSNGLKPIFADIDPQTFNLNPENIESAVTEKTSAIVPVHVFGNACEVEEIEKIANKHDLRVIYDAAHAFGVKYKGESLLNHGNVSTLSFHATKLFHTIEGGALIINDDALVEEARFLINFGIDGPDSVKALGTNAKMNEFEAAMGLCVLDDIEKITANRKEVFECYKSGLEGVVKFQQYNADSTYNYSYFPALFENEEQTLKVQKALNKADIFPRRYFYPSLDTLPYLEVSDIMHVSRSVSKRILTLPMYPELLQADQNIIIEIVKQTVKEL
ncbi:DegT/DnrJ/EryC1/StrS family aminotransferase [Sulfurovum sp.]|uniref:DegT/DnrJ/EryC1/StrS family aminotransferase n=1 Tax=Sulfurovum sp. TaxID=1969726 RepID=UPI003567816C